MTNAWAACHKRSTKNRELILTYLIPCRLITHNEVPSAQLLQEFPHLQTLFGDVVSSIKKGDLAGLDRAFAEGEPEFVRRRVFLTLERSRDIALRNLLRKVFLAAGYEDLKEGQTEKDRIRKTRIPLAHFQAAVRMGSGSGQAIDDEEVECMLANMIYKVRTRRVGGYDACHFACHLACNPNPLYSSLHPVCLIFLSLNWTESICLIRGDRVRQPCHVDIGLTMHRAS